MEKVSIKNENMYHFNLRLLAELPRIFGVNESTFAKMAGLSVSGYRKWIHPDTYMGMRMYNFIETLNRLHISISEFLTTDEDVPVKKTREDYVIPSPLWSDIVWKNEEMKELYGVNSIIGIASCDAIARKVGFANGQTLKRSILTATSMTLGTFLRILEAFSLDAKRYIEDRNRTIPSPFARMNIPSRLNLNEDVANENKDLKRNISHLEYRLGELLLENGRLKKENASLRERMEADASSLKHGIHAVLPPSQKGYAFHKELWMALPSMFGLTAMQFCDIAGIRNNMFTPDYNFRMETVIGVCNHFHISITHFFPPRSEPLVVNDRWYYEIPERAFVPIEDRRENMKYLFGKYSIFGHSVKTLNKVSGVSSRSHKNMSDGSYARKFCVITIADICTGFNISPSLFFKDENVKHQPPYASSRNEQLIENCIRMSQEIHKLRIKLRADNKESK